MANKPQILCLFGMVDSGKTTVAEALQKSVRGSVMIDGDDFRKFERNDDVSIEGRIRNIERLADLIDALKMDGVIVLSFGMPTSAIRGAFRARHPQTIFIHCWSSLADCQARDTKGLYARVLVDDSAMIAGINLPFDAEDADLTINTSDHRTLTGVGNAYRCALGILDHITKQKEPTHVQADQ